MLRPHPLLQHVDHRPYALPAEPWAWQQTWRRLLFMHWPMPAEAIQARLPAGLEVDLYEGEAWLGVVPFKLCNLAHRPLPPIPGAQQFPEMNLRTYVRPTKGGPGGVYFFSLDAAHWLACRTARLLLNLPYFYARMTADEHGDETRYDSRRREKPAGIGFAGRYRPTGEVFHAADGSIDQFVTERYCLYVRDHRDRLTRVDIHHGPWPLQPAEVEIARNDLASGQGFTLPDVPPLLHYAERIDMIGWPPARQAG